MQGRFGHAAEQIARKADGVANPRAEYDAPGALMIFTGGHFSGAASFAAPDRYLIQSQRLRLKSRAF